MPATKTPVTYPNSTHITEHFTWTEARCKCGRCRIPERVKPAIIHQAKALEKLRALVGGPLLITSWYRCPACNKAVGGASKSEHMDGSATDFVSRQHTPRELAALCEKVPEFDGGGIGTYPSWVHADSARGPHRPARW